MHIDGLEVDIYRVNLIEVSDYERCRNTRANMVYNNINMYGIFEKTKLHLAWHIWGLSSAKYITYIEKMAYLITIV